MTHGSRMSQMLRTTATGETSAYVRIRNRNPDVLEPAAGFVIRSILHAEHSACRLFEWTEAPDVRRLLVEVRDL